MDLKQSLIKFCHVALYALMCILLIGAGVSVLIKAASGFEVFVGITAIIIALCNVVLGFLRMRKKEETNESTAVNAGTAAKAKASSSTASAKKANNKKK